MSERKRALVLLAGIAIAATVTTAKQAQSLPKSGTGAKELAGTNDVTGSFSIIGSGPDGKQYTGSAGISKIGGEMYKGTWTIGTSTSSGICFRDEDILSCGWSFKHDLGVVAYLVKDDNSLDGVWFEEQHTTLGKEYLVGGNANLLGNYTIKSGETPEKKKYSGTVDIGIKNGVYTFKWKTGGQTFDGLGLRNGDVLTAGFNNTGDFGVLQYRIKKGGKVLTGLWAQSKQSGSGPGVETLTKKF